MFKRAKHQRTDKNSGGIACDGVASLGLSRSARRRLGRALDDARRLAVSDIEAGDGLRRVAADARMIEAVQPRERLRGLPACRGEDFEMQGPACRLQRRAAVFDGCQHRTG